MERETKDRLFSIITIVLSVAAFPLSCTLWGGIVCAVASVAFVLIHNRFFDGNRVVTAAFWIAVAYLSVFVLYLIFAGVYRATIERNMRLIEGMR